MSDTFVPFDQRSEFVWRDGKIVPNSQATTHVLNHSLHYSGSVFEGVRIYNGHIFLNGAHAVRLVKGVKDHRYNDFNYTVPQIMEGCREIVAKLGLKSGYIRPVVHRGSQDLFVGGARNTIHFDIIAFPLDIPANDLKLKTGSLRRASADAMLVDNKCSEVFAAGTIGKDEATKAGFDDVMFLDQKGYIADCSAANLFFAIDGKLHTPEPNSILPGYTRAVIIKLAALRGIEVVEREMRPEEIKKATEAFSCGTALEVHPIVRIDDTMIPKGSITDMLISDYMNLVQKSPAEVDDILGTSGEGANL